MTSHRRSSRGCPARDTPAGGRLPEIRKALRRLSQTITVHFEHEERLMRASRKQLHGAASRKEQRFALAINRGDREAGRALVAYLTEWLHAHTLALPTG